MSSEPGLNESSNPHLWMIERNRLSQILVYHYKWICQILIAGFKCWEKSCGSPPVSIPAPSVWTRLSVLCNLNNTPQMHLSCGEPLETRCRGVDLDSADCCCGGWRMRKELQHQRLLSVFCHQLLEEYWAALGWVSIIICGGKSRWFHIPCFCFRVPFLKKTHIMVLAFPVKMSPVPIFFAKSEKMAWQIGVYSTK